MAVPAAPRAHECELVRRLVTTWGADTLAPFALRADKSYFFSDDESAFLAYRVVGGVAIVSGDPIGCEDVRRELIRRFLEFAHDRGWRVAVLGVSERCLGLYRELGLRVALPRGRGGRGDGGVLARRPRDPQGAAVGAPVEDAGFETRVLRPSEIDEAMRAELETIARVWRGDRAGTRLRDGARHALPARRRRRGLRGRLRPGRPRREDSFTSVSRMRAPRCRSRRCRASGRRRTGSRSG